MPFIRQLVSVCWAITTSCLSSPVLWNICQLRSNCTQATWLWWSLHTAYMHEKDKPGHEAEAAHRGGGWTGVWSTQSDISMRSTKYSAFIEAQWREATITNMFLLCALSHCNNVLFTYTTSCCEHTLFSSLLYAKLQCQRSLCTTSWCMEAQSEHSLEMRAPIHIQTESKLLLCCSFHTEVHIVLLSVVEEFYST